MNEAKSLSPADPFIHRGVAGLAGGFVALWIWSCYCAFPGHDWNSMRLEPSLMMHAGVNPYPLLDGPLTTWIYGPVPIFLQWPAAFFSKTVPALLCAAAINVAIGLGPITWAVHTAARSSGATKSDGMWATLLAFAAWPAGNLIFCQADNSSVAFGILATIVLAEAKTASPGRLWLAAFLAGLSLWSKQTEVAPLLAQAVFLWLRFGPREAVGQLLRVGSVSALLGLGFMAKFGAEGLIYNMFVVPAGFPTADFFAKATHAIYRSYVLLLIVLPLLFVATWGRRWLQRGHPAFLATLVFIFSVPFNLGGFATIGGNVNSLHGVLYLLPWMGVALAQKNFARWPNRTAISFFAVAVILFFQVFSQGMPKFRPDTAALAQADILARRLPNQIYFPWNPLPTFFSDGKFYHAEDGILTRNVANKPVSPALLSAYLPSQLGVVAYRHRVSEGPIFQSIPRQAKRDTYGEWMLYSWARPDAPAPVIPSMP